MANGDLRYWLWLSGVCGTASSRTDALTERFGFDAEAIFHADRAIYEEIGFTGAILESLCRKDLTVGERIESDCAENGIRPLTPCDPEYPAPLRQIMGRPLVLYVKGELPDPASHLLLAMVGTRRMTAYGKNMAYRIGFDLARKGVCVVSGMAKGVDAVSHRGCLDGGGKTVAVLGCGADICYPAEHRALKEEIEQNGAVVTEYPPHYKPNRGTFPARNRLISALTRGTLVVEADEESGALITARRALAQGKDLYALPGNVGEQNSTGTNGLIRRGAVAVTDADDLTAAYVPLFASGVLERLPYTEHKPVWNIANRSSAPEKKPEIRQETAPAPDARLDTLGAAERTVYERIPQSSSVSPDTIAGKDLTAVEVMTACTVLEILGLIECVPGGNYRRK